MRRVEDHTPRDCKERDRLREELNEAIKATIRARGKQDSAEAWKTWKAARREFMHHIQEHGC